MDRALSRSVPAAAATAAAILLLHQYSLQTAAFFPACPFHQLTGLLCPGCGATRALAALTHAHLSEALQANPLVPTSLCAVSLYLLLAACLRLRSGQPRPWPAIPSPLIAAALLLTAAFTVWRNLA